MLVKIKQSEINEGIKKAVQENGDTERVTFMRFAESCRLPESERINIQV